MTRKKTKKTGEKSALKKARDGVRRKYKAANAETIRVGIKKRNERLANRPATAATLALFNRAERSEYGRLNPRKK